MKHDYSTPCNMISVIMKPTWLRMSHPLVTPSESYLSFLSSFMLSSSFLIPCLAMHNTGIWTISRYLGYNVDHWLGLLPILHWTFHSTLNSSSQQLCLVLLTALTGWVPTPIKSRLGNVHQVWILMDVANWLAGLPRKGGRLPLTWTTITTRYEVVLVLFTED